MARDASQLDWPEKAEERDQTRTLITLSERSSLSTIVRKFHSVDHIAIFGWQVGAIRELLGLALHVQLLLQGRVTEDSEAFFLCPETAAVRGPIVNVVATRLPMVRVVTSDGLAKLGVVLVPPGLALAVASPASGIGGYTICRLVTSATSFFGLRRRRTFAKPISPTE
jgi:hypothetical protein